MRRITRGREIIWSNRIDDHAEEEVTREKNKGASHDRGSLRCHVSVVALGIVLRERGIVERGHGGSGAAAVEVKVIPLGREEVVIGGGGEERRMTGVGRRRGEVRGRVRVSSCTLV